MLFNKYALVCALLAISILEPISARKSYPRSGGLSGSRGHHGYPSSGGLSGTGSHGYPSSSGGLSGSGGHGYPSSSGGLSGTGGSRGSHTYPSSGNNHGYPSSGGGLSGNNPTNTHHNQNHNYPAGNRGVSGGTTTTNIHNHYHYNYNPPQQIRYTPSYGGSAVSYPVYRGTPPTYVYQYKDSGSKYGTLLAGLALLNLGAIGTAAYAASRHSNYKPQPGEICKFGMKKDNGDYEETKIDCQLITSFIFQEEAKTAGAGGSNTTTITTSVTNVTTTNGTNAVVDPNIQANQTSRTLYEMLPNGTLVPVHVPMNATANSTADSSTNNTMTSSVTTITTTNSTTVTNALDVKGKPVEVTPGMKCFVIRQTPSTNMRKSVACGLLTSYADQSLKRNSAVRNGPVFSILAAALVAFVMH